MIKRSHSSIKILIAIFMAVTLLFIAACKKDKVPIPNPHPEITKYEKIAGTYNVYDSLGNFLYQMSLSHSDSIFSTGMIVDTIHFHGLDGQFDFSESQGSPSNPVNYFIKIGYHGPLYDTLFKRWKIIFSYDPDGVYNNTYQNDTIRFIYQKVNINYYIEDLVPYKDTIIKIVAVKQ